MGQSGSFFSGLSLLFYERSRPQIEHIKIQNTNTIKSPDTATKLRIWLLYQTIGSYSSFESNPQRTIDAEHRKTIKIRYICSLGQWNYQERESDGQKALHHPPKIPAS